MASPSPAPPFSRERARSPRQKRSKTRGAPSDGIPSPVSSTLTRTSSPSCSTTTATEPSDGVCRSAFVSRLKRTRSTLSGADDRRVAVELGAQGYAARIRLGLEAAQRGLHEPGKGSLPELERERAGVDSRELEEVVDEETQRAHLFAQGRQVAVGWGEAVLEGLQHRLHRGQRGSEVVARPRHKLPAERGSLTGALSGSQSGRATRPSRTRTRPSRSSAATASRSRSGSRRGPSTTARSTRARRWRKDPSKRLCLRRGG
jgi:hypothetical protein